MQRPWALNGRRRVLYARNCRVKRRRRRGDLGVGLVLRGHILDGL